MSTRQISIPDSESPYLRLGVRVPLHLSLRPRFDLKKETLCISSGSKPSRRVLTVVIAAMEGGAQFSLMLADESRFLHPQRDLIALQENVLKHCRALDSESPI